MSKILFRADGSRETGFGHLSRSAILASAMRPRGYEPHFITWGADDAVRGFLSARGLPFVETPHAGGEEGARFHAEAMRKSGAVCTVLDSYHLDDAFRAHLKGSHGAPLAVVDDLYRHFSHADAVINHNPSADAGRYEGFKGSLFLGSQYALIDPAFAAGRADTGGTPSIVVMMGGTDALGQMDRVLRLLDTVEADFRMVSLFGGYGARPDVSGLRHKCVLVPFTDDLPNVIAGCAAAVTAGGITCMELACAGIPFLAVLTDRHQMENAKAYERSGAGEYAGALWELSNEELAVSFRRFFTHRPAWPEMGRIGRSLIDGQGAARAAAALASIIPRQ